MGTWLFSCVWLSMPSTELHSSMIRMLLTWCKWQDTTDELDATSNITRIHLKTIDCYFSLFYDIAGNKKSSNFMWNLSCCHTHCSIRLFVVYILFFRTLFYLSIVIVVGWSVFVVPWELQPNNNNNNKLQLSCLNDHQPMKPKECCRLRWSRSH